jgi:hypothetical protein
MSNIIKLKGENMSREFVETKNGIIVYRNYKDNLCCQDTENKALTQKAEMSREKIIKGKAKDLSRFGSMSSEDAVTWSLFRTLELKNKMNIFYKMLDIDDELEKVVFWIRDTRSGNVDLQLKAVLDFVEPRKYWQQQTEPDVIIVGKKTVIFNESKLGYKNQSKSGWSRPKDFGEKQNFYKEFMSSFNNEFMNNFKVLGKKYYQLMRNVIVGEQYTKKIQKKFHLSVIVNANNKPAKKENHLDRFNEFKRFLKNGECMHYLTWQDIAAELDKSDNFSELSKYIQSRCLITQKPKYRKQTNIRRQGIF